MLIKKKVCVCVCTHSLPSFPSFLVLPSFLPAQGYPVHPLDPLDQVDLPRPVKRQYHTNEVSYCICWLQHVWQTRHVLSINPPIRMHECECVCVCVRACVKKYQQKSSFLQVELYTHDCVCHISTFIWKQRLEHVNVNIITKGHLGEKIFVHSV